MKNILLVFQDLYMFQGFERIFREMKDEWDIRYVKNPREAIDIIVSQPIELVLSELNLPEMDGTDFLEKVKGIKPHIVRIILADPADEELVARSANVAHQFLAKSSDAETFKLVIERAYRLRGLIANEYLVELITSLEYLPALPGKYSQILKEINASQPSIKKLAELVAQDITMTARILQLANSAFYGIPKKIVNLQQAITLLGLKTLKAVFFYSQALSESRPQRVPGLSLDQLWEHSMLVANIAQEVLRSETTDRLIADNTMIAGILHDIGRLVMVTIPDYRKRTDRLIGQEGKTLLEAEYELFSTSHAEAGAYLLSLWGFDDEVVEAVAYHHQPLNASKKGMNPTVALYLAHWLIGSENGPDQFELDLALLDKLDLKDKREEWRECCQKVRR